MKRIMIMMILVLALSVAVVAAPPSGPFVSDANTVVLLHLDGDLTNSGSPTYTATFSGIGGYSNPVSSTSQAGFGQSLFGNGAGTLNGLVINPGSISQIPSPQTVETWQLMLSADSALEYTDYWLDLGAGRCIYQIRNAGNDPNNYMQLNVWTNGTSQWAYCVIPKSSIIDGWHHFRINYDIAASTTVMFYVDGIEVTTLQGGTPVEFDYTVLSYPAAAIGRVWPPAAPSSNLAPFRGFIDELRFSNINRSTNFAVPVELSNFNTE